MNMTLEETVIPEELYQAYIETDYIVQTEPKLVLQIGEQLPELIQLHKQHQVDCSTFITAYNPYSQSYNLEQNNFRQKQLMHELKKQKLKFIDGVGQHPSNHWLGEPSLFVLGLSLAEAKTLGARFEQNALVWVDLDAVPKLVLLR